MSVIAPRRPSPVIGPAHGLWSLWDMMSNWGYRYLHIGAALAYAEVDLQRYALRQALGVAPIQRSEIEADNPIIDALYSRCEEISALSQDQELGAIPGNVTRLKARIIAARKQIPNGRGLLTEQILEDVTRLKNDFAYILENRFFYDLEPGLHGYYANPELFGGQVTVKFKESRDDIEHAGNCLALGEGTACVLHLVRALEVIVRHLGKRLKVTINPIRGETS
jgi:hypothetical protein